ncbi:MAG: acyl-CoA dehydrogenase, partial [Rhodobacterales bacterium]|nr:acyl-CoA dehydrogenase [Rhodobacterales bacterium]
MDYALTPELSDLRKRVRALLDETIIPVEHKVIEEDSHGDYTTLRELQAQVKS